MELNESAVNRKIGLENSSNGEGVSKGVEQAFALLMGFAKQQEKELSEMLSWTDHIGELKKDPRYQPLYDVNLFDKYHAYETDISWVFSKILNYTQRDEESDSTKTSYILFEAFAKEYLQPLGFDPSWIANPSIRTEEWNIDICMREKDYAVIFENKIKNAVYQRNQIGKYIARLEEEGYKDEQIFVVILPPSYSKSYVRSMRPSVWKCPEDWEKPNQARHCALSHDAYLCWCDASNYDHQPYCDSCSDDLRTKFEKRTVVLNQDFAEWLLSAALEKVPERQSTLRSAMIQTADYLKGIYHTRINNELLEEMQNYLKSQLFKDLPNKVDQWDAVTEKLEQLEDLRTGLKAVQVSVSRDMVEEWYNALIEDKTLQEKKYKLKRINYTGSNLAYGIQINGIWCGIWSGEDNDGQPYWGFYAENTPSKAQMTMVREILDGAGINVNKIDIIQRVGFIAWDSTRNGAERCKAFYLAAK